MIEDRNAVEEALAVADRSKAEFTDVLIAIRHRNAGCTTTVTFDKAAAKLPDMELLR